MSNARAGPTGAFRPTRTTRSTAAATSTSNAVRSATTSRPPSVASNGRPGSSSGLNSTSRPGSAVGFSSGAARPGAAAAGTSRTGAAVGTNAGVKRKTRTTSAGAEPEPAAAKRPALSSAFSAHVTQTALNRQLLAAQTQVTELQNSLLEKQGKIDRLEADLRIMGTREEEEREARKQSEEELAKKTREFETDATSLKRRLAELEADHEDLDDAYSTLSHTSQSKIAALNLELTTRDERIALLETQLNESEAMAREEEIRAKALEELLEQMAEEDAQPEGEESGEGGDVDRNDEEPKEAARLEMEFKEPESSVDDPGSVKGETEDDEDDLDADADGEVDPEEDVSMVVDTDGDATQTGDIEISSIRSGSPSEANTFYEGGQPEIEAYPDPGAPPPYTVSSPLSPALSSEIPSTRAPSPICLSSEIPSTRAPFPRLLSSEIPSTPTASIASSRAMSIVPDGTPIRPVHRSPSGTPLSTVSSSRLDPLSHIRRRLSLAASNRRRSSLGASRDHERDKDNEIVRAELARQTAHLATLEATNSRLASEVMRLRMRADGAEVLREEKRELERRVEGVEALRTCVAELEAEKAEFAQREREWEARLREHVQVVDENSTPSRTPVGVTQQLATLRKAHTALLDEHGQLKASLRTYEIELAGAREESENAASDVALLQREVGQLQDAVARKEKERVLLERDATFLRSLVSSYKNEEAVHTTSEVSEHTSATEKLEQRISQLEALLSEYKSTIESLEEEVDSLQRSGSGAANRSQEQWDQLVRTASTLEEAFRNAQAEVTRQSEHVDELEQRLFELGGEIGGGRHIPPGTRVLSLRQNPAQEWADTRKEVLDRLRNENEALLAHIKDLEEQGVRGGPAATGSDPSDENAQFVPRASWESLKQETTGQQAALEQKEKRLLRLQQVYSAKSTEFREAIASILGLKLAFYPNGQVRVTSMYDLSATYVFQPSKKKDELGAEDGATMQLVGKGEDSPQELEGLMNTWIRDEMCIPCFMASVTLECYDKWKSEQRAAGLA